jgi:hypothetical protein
VGLSETIQTLVGLAVVVPNGRLLVVGTPRGQLELPWSEIGEVQGAAGRLAQFIAKLGLDQMPCQTLYLPALRARKQQATGVMVAVHLVKLEKAQRFEIPNSRYEAASTLAQNETATPVTRAVARWLLETGPG